MQDRAAVVSAYATDLGRFPLWAIGKGITAIVRGEAKVAPQFVPTSLEVRKAVEWVMKPFWDELERLRDVLDAVLWHDPGDAGRAKVKHLFATLRTSMRLEPLRGAPVISERDQGSSVREPSYDPTAPAPKLSVEALARLGIAPRKKAGE